MTKAQQQIKYFLIKITKMKKIKSINLFNIDFINK